MITYQKERFPDLIMELPSLWRPHWREVALNRDVIKLAPSWEEYIALDKCNVLHVMTARADGKLIGYYFALVRPHLHYKHSLTAFSDIFFIQKEFRKGLTGYKLFLETEKMLKALGVQKSYVMTKAHLPITILMKRLKYRFIERTYSKLL